MQNKSKSKKICVIGLGYIGLPTASMFASQGFQVQGVDTNPVVIQTLNQGRIHIEEPGLSTVVKSAIQSQNLKVSAVPSEADVFIIAVPTPHYHDHGQVRAEMSYVQSALESILPYVKPGNLVILESTSPAGTISDLVVPMLRKRGFNPGLDVGVAYCPERVIPGQALKELIENDRVIGAINVEWGQVTRDLYKSFVSGDIFITDSTVAEMVKLVENTYRDVNIALANEVALICEKLNINVWDVIQMANRHPRVNVHRPGPGVGGHCISVDPWFLVEKFPDLARIILMARNINDSMPEHVVQKVLSLLPNDKAPKIAILGLAYKGNVDDYRESPSICVIKGLQRELPEAKLSIYDPHVKSQEFNTLTIPEVFSDADLGILLTPHDEYRFLDPQEVGALMSNKIILDTHNFLKKDRWLQAGFGFHLLGCGGSSQFKIDRYVSVE